MSKREADAFDPQNRADASISVSTGAGLDACAIKEPEAHWTGQAIAWRRLRRFGTRLRGQPGCSLWKRVLDLVLCAIAMPVAVPVLCACALAVRVTSPGPVFFVQERTGWAGRRFRMLKFRTMVVGAHDMKAGLSQANVMSGPDFKLRDDPRVTPVGRFLRRTSLDEAPQVFNILIGDMSWVGPRPTSFTADTYALWQTERLDAVPGLTGLWQVGGRALVDFDDRVRMDIEYVRTRDIALDLSILLKTVPAVLSQRGAY